MLETILRTLGLIASGWVGNEAFRYLRDKWKDRNAAERRNRHIYILEAIGTEPGRLGAPDLSNTRFDTYTIGQRLRLKQAGEVLGDEPLLASTGREPQYAEQFRDQAKRLGLPDAQLTPDERAKQLKAILHEMAEAGKLIFVPPDHWKVRQ